jgi:hypothetical protein
MFTEKLKDIPMSFDYEALGRLFFQLEMPPFNAYLETICEFLKAETKKHHEDIEDFREQIRSGKIVPDDKPDEMPWEQQYEEHIDYLINEIEEYENILLKSFFVTIYGFLESQLMQRCRTLEQLNKDVTLSISEIRGEGVNKAITYLIKVQHIDLSLSNNLEWERIQNYNALRNCIVHNEGRLDDGLKEGRDKLEKFINRKDSNLHLYDSHIIFTQEFCKQAWKTIEEFLWLVSEAETQAKE